MSSNRIQFDGLEEFRQQLRGIPDELTAEAGGIVLDAATSAKGDIESAYSGHTRTGNLGRGLDVSKSAASRFGASAIVRSRAPHGFIFERGTKRRQTATGANRGTMPAARIFIPAAVRRRRAMYDALRDMLVRHGFLVSGST